NRSRTFLLFRTEAQVPVKICILSRNKDLYSTRRLVEASRERNHDPLVIDYLRCYINITAHRPRILFGGGGLEGIDAVIPRIGASHAFSGTAIVRQFETMGTYTINRSQAISRSRDKLRSLQILARRGIGLPV